MELILVFVLGAVLGSAVVSAWLRQSFAARTAALSTERDLLRERVVDLEAAVSEDAQTAALLSPLRDALGRVEQQVTTLERDRVEQYGALSSRLGEVAQSTASLQQETATLAGALNSSTTRGTWGEMQLRRVLEHAGMLARCDFEEQVSATNRHGARVRPDVVVRLPGERTLVVDSKAPLSAFLRAQTDGLDTTQQREALTQHARALRTHVDGLAAKDYWSAFEHTPEFVVCFVPGDAILAAALSADPALMDRALERRVVLSSPSTLLALLRTVALAWQQDALTTHARELLEIGRELHSRLGRLGQHVTETGTALRRSVESYNAMVGSLESRVLVTARKFAELDVVDEPMAEVPLVEATPRTLSAPELLEHVTSQDARPQLDLGERPGDETLGHRKHPCGDPMHAPGRLAQ